MSESLQPQRKSRFVNAETTRIELGQGDYVLIPKRLSYELAEHFQNFKEEGKKNIPEILAKAIVEWNLLMPDGVTIAPVTSENIRLLDVNDVVKIVSEITAEINLQTPPKGV